MMQNPMGNEPLEELFVIEANQLVQQLEMLIISCEKQNDIGLSDVDSIFRMIHTIKGSSAMMAFEQISNLSHAVEDLFSYIREHKDKQFQFNHVFDLVLLYIDFIKTEIEKLENKQAPDGDASHLLKRSKAILKQLENSENRKEPDEKKKRFAGIHVLFEQNAEMEHVRCHLLMHSLQKLMNEVFVTIPDSLDLEQNASVIKENGFFACFSTANTQTEIEQILKNTANIRSFEIKEFDILPFDLETEFLGETKDDAKQLPVHSQNYISVHQDKLNTLMNLVGELVTAQAMVIKNPDLKGLKLPNFQKAAQELEKLVDDLRDAVVDIRMLPLSVVFQKMHRIIRDMSSQLGKEVAFTVSGEDTQVDKSVTDILSEPIMHLIRNAVDHGIESVEERKKAGKSSVGKVTLRAWQNSSYAFIEVADDGRGLNKEEIYRTITKTGLADKPFEAYSEQELYSFILSAGFTTSNQITTYSGRGVGMDVVKKSIEAVGGDIFINSEWGKGTSFIIRIPLTLLIINVMHIKVGDAVLAVPIRSVFEAKRVNPDDVVKDANDNEMIIIRDTCYPIVRLHRFFEIHTKTSRLEDGILLFVEGNRTKACLFADRLLGEQQIVVKPLPQFIQNTSGISGCSILNDGNLSLILDLNEILSFKGE